MSSGAVTGLAGLVCAVGALCFCYCCCWKCTKRLFYYVCCWFVCCPRKTLEQRREEAYQWQLRRNAKEAELQKATPLLPGGTPLPGPPKGPPPAKGSQREALPSSDQI